MGIKTEQVQISIDVKTQNAVREVAKLQHEYQDLIPQVDQARKAVDKASASLEKFKKTERIPSNTKWKEAYDNYYKQLRVYDDLKESAEKYNAQIERQISKLGMAGLTNKELNRYYNDQKRALDGLRRGTDEYAEALRRLKKTQEEKSIRRTDITGEKSTMDSLKGGLVPALIGGLAGGAVGMAGQVLSNVLGSINDKIDAIVKKSDRMTDLANAIQGTTEEAEKLNAAISKIDTRLEIKTRREIATEAGKLDVPTEQIVEYTKAMAEAVIVMESDFPDGAGKMTEVFTKIKGLYSDTKALDYPSSVRSIGSALKGLADEGTATAKWSSEFLLRLGALDEKIRPTITDLLGLGAALEESGLTDEIAASGVQNILSKAYKNTEGFAKFFGQSKKDFEAFINLNPNKFLLEFAERIKPLTATQKTQTLSNLTIDSQEAAKVLGVLVNKTDEVIDKQGKANSLFLEGSRLTELYATKNDNLAGKVERATNKISAFFTNSKLATGLGSLIGGLADATIRLFDTSTNIEKLTDKFNSQKSVVNRLDNSISPLLDRYDELKKKGKEGQDVQKDLTTIVGNLAGVLPASAIQFDNYGKAIGISTDKAREFIKIQKAMLKAQNAELITNLQSDLKSTESKIAKLQKMTSGKLGTGRDGKEQFIRDKYDINDILNLEYRSYSPEIFKKLNGDLSTLTENANSTKLAIKGLSGENIEIPQTTKVKPPAESNFNPDDVLTPKGKKGKSPAEKLHDELIANEARTLAEITKMRIEAIADENFKKESQLRQDFEDENAAQLKLVSSKKLSQESYNSWLSYRKDTLNRELIKNDTDTEKKAREEAEKVNIAAAKRRIEHEKESLQAKLALANATEDKAAALDIKLMMLVADKELELLTATEEEKLSIIGKYKIREQALRDEFDFDKAKSDKANLEKAKDEQDKADKKIEDAKRSLYQKIGGFISQTQNAIGEIFAFEKQGLENQLNQENARFDKKVKNLDKQKEKGIISEEEYQTAVDKLNAEHDAKEREIKKKMWEADKKARIANIIMSTAQAVVQGLAQGSIALSILGGVVGAIQLATAMNTEYPGYAIGDFTGKGSTQKYAGKKPTPTSELAWVNENGPEFILNNDGVNMPEFPMILPMLRKLNRRQSIFPDLRPMLAPPKVGYAIGDFTGPAEFARRKARNTASIPQNNCDSNDRMLIAIEEFNKHCREGTWAKVMFSHKMADDFNELLIENEEVRSRASAK